MNILKKDNFVSILFLSLAISSFISLPHVHATEQVPQKESLQRQIKIVKLSESDNIVPREVIVNTFKESVEKIVRNVISTKSDTLKIFSRVQSLSLSEAKLYFMDYALECIKGQPNQEKLLEEIFSPKYFSYTPPSFSDILTLDHKDQIEFLSKTPYLESAIFNNTLEEEKYRIDQSCFLLPSDVVRKWYYNRDFCWPSSS